MTNVNKGVMNGLPLKSSNKPFFKGKYQIDRTNQAQLQQLNQENFIKKIKNTSNVCLKTMNTFPFTHIV